jgi:pimeloyl-ACP methyl ester carboxylesterase
MIVAGSLLGGLLAAALLVVGPFAGAGEHAITGAILLGFAFGWALLAVLSARYGDRPRRWARVPAAAMGSTGAALLILAPGDAALGALGWVWPLLLLALVAWMVTRVRREPPSRTRPWLLYPLFALLALLAAGGAYETIGAATDGGAQARSGDRMIDVGGHRLQIRCTGSGSPAVILEPGLGESAADMGRWIAPDVARTTTVCVYDRAGHGRSEDGARRQDADAVARDLHALLVRAGVRAPYVLAGHSLGGMFALNFARRHPRELAGVALIDSMHPQQSTPFAGTDAILAIVPTLARTGLARLVFSPAGGDPTRQARRLALDIADMPAELAQAARLTSLGSRPLAVVTAARDRQAGWLEHQHRLAGLSTNVVEQVVPGSTHASLTGDPRDAAASAAAITSIVAAVRDDRPLLHHSP